MDALLSEINNLSVNTLATLESRQESVETSQVKDLVVEDWIEQLHGVVTDWIGNRFHCYHGDSRHYFELLQREFGAYLDEAINEVLDGNILAKHACHVKIKILDKSFDHKHWEKINLDYELNGKHIKVTNGVIFLDTLKDEIKIVVWKKKTTEVTRERSNIGHIQIPFRLLATNDTKKHPITQSDEWLKLNIETRNRIGPTAAEFVRSHISKAILDHIRALFPNHELPMSVPKIRAKYVVVIQKSASTPFYLDRAHVVFQGDAHTSNVTELDINDLIRDEIHLEIDTDEGKRNSLLLMSSPLKKREKLAIKSSLAITQSPNNVSLKSDKIKEVVMVRDLPWRRKVKVSQKGAYWTLELRGAFDGVQGELEYDLRTHLKMLFKSFLDQLASEQLYEWDGLLKGPWKCLDVVTKPFQGGDRGPLALEVLCELHNENPFNNYVMAEAIHLVLNADASDAILVGRGAGITQYYSQCLNRFLGLEWRDLPGFCRISQLQCIVQNLDMLHTDRSEESLKNLQSTLTEMLTSHLRGKSEQFLSEYMDGHALLMIHKVMGKFKKNNLWVVLFANAVQKSILQAVRAKYDEQLDIRKMNRIFVTMLEVQERSTLKEEDLFYVFERFVRPWMDEAVREARIQVQRVIEEEKSHHKQSPANWDDWSDERMDWLESSIHLNGIFQSCFLAWEDLKWNNLVVHLELGLQLFQGMHGVFQEYVQMFLDLVLADQKFEKHELVIILHNVVEGMDYLHFFLNTISIKISGSKEPKSLKEIRDELRKVSDVLSQASIEADDQAENIVTKFCEHQRKTFKYYSEKGSLINEAFDEDSDEETLLSYMNSLLEFLFKHVESEKYRLILKREIFLVLDEELEIMFNKASMRYAKTRQPEVFEKIASILPFAIQFRRNMGLRDGNVLTKIHKDLYPRGNSTHELIATVVEEMAGPKSEGQRGQLTFEAKYDEDVQAIEVTLLEVKEVPMRKKDELPNLFVSLNLFPLTREPHIIRLKTLCFEKRQNLEFDRTNGKFYFNLPRNSFNPDTVLLQIEVSYQLALLHSTIAGLTFIKLGDMNGDKVTKQLVLPETHILRSVEHLELKRRKDPQAKAFVRRVDNLVQRKKVIQTQEWASEDNHVSSYLITSHLERLLQIEDDNPNKKNQTVGHINVKLGFNESSEELYIDVVKVEGVRRRLKRNKVAFSVGFRVLPLSQLHLKETFSDVYCDTHYFKPTSDTDPMPKEEKCIKLREVSYNYHKSFVQILLFDNERPHLLETKAERFFRGHVLLPLADIHPFSVQLNFRYVKAERFTFVSIRSDDDSNLQRLRQRKDELAKTYVKEFDALRDQEGFSYPYIKDDWIERVTIPSHTLIAKHLQLLSHGKIPIVEDNGTLAYSIQPGVKLNTLEITLESITDLKPMADAQACNFEVVMEILPSRKPPFGLAVKTAVIKDRMSLIFDLQDEDTPEERIQDKFGFELCPDLFNLEETHVIFELYDHRLASKHFRGMFLKSLQGGTTFKHERGSFCKLAHYKENTMEFHNIVKLEEASFIRRKESDIKTYIERFKRYHQNKPINTLFSYIDGF